MAGLRVLDSLADPDDLATQTPDVYVRYSEGWEADARHGNTDTESSLGLPGAGHSRASRKTRCVVCNRP